MVIFVLICETRLRTCLRFLIGISNKKQVGHLKMVVCFDKIITLDLECGLQDHIFPKISLSAPLDLGLFLLQKHIHLVILFLR